LKKVKPSACLEIHAIITQVQAVRPFDDLRKMEPAQWTDTVQRGKARARQDKGSRKRKREELAAGRRQDLEDKAQKRGAQALKRQKTKDKHSLTTGCASVADLDTAWTKLTTNAQRVKFCKDQINVHKHVHGVKAKAKVGLSRGGVDYSAEQLKSNLIILITERLASGLRQDNPGGQDQARVVEAAEQEHGDEEPDIVDPEEEDDGLNESDDIVEEQDEDDVCVVCESNEGGGWIACEGKCKGWFHQRCVGIDGRTTKGKKILKGVYKCDECQLVAADINFKLR
jgi:hypothetical protein